MKEGNGRGWLESVGESGAFGMPGVLGREHSIVLLLLRVHGSDPVGWNRLCWDTATLNGQSF